MKFALIAALALSSHFAFAQETSSAPVPPTSAPETAPTSAPPMTEPSAEPRYADSAQWRFALGLGLTLSSKLTTKNGKITGGGFDQSLESELDYKNALILTAEAQFLPRQSWGFTGGLQIDGEREFDSGTVTTGGATVKLSGSANTSKLSVLNIYGNAAYRWEEFYLPFGLNLSSVKFTPAPSFTGTHEETGGLGAQFGVGLLMQDRWNLELMSRVVAVNLKSTSGGVTSDYGNGFLGSLLIQGKYVF